MYRILYCLKDHHDWNLVFLAAMVCLVSCGVAVLIIDRARQVKGMARLRWIATAGAAGGFGIWATHFISMLAFNPGMGVGYDIRLTLLSLLCAMAITAIGIEVAISRSFKGADLTGGAIIGSGIASMHFLGMMALELPGHIVWAPDLVVVSIGLGLMLGAAAMWGMAQKRGGRWLAGTFLLLAIVTHHFTAMGAVTILPDPQHVVTGLIISGASMSVTLAVAALAVLGLCLAAVLSGRRADTIKAEGDQRLEILLNGVTDYAIFMLDPDGYVTSWTAGAERIKGYTAEEAIGRHFADVSAMDAAAAQNHAQGLKTALEHGRYEVEFPGKRKDGSTYFGHSVITPVYNVQGKLLGFAHFTQDVTARKADHERILEVSRNLDAALSHMSHGLCLFDRNERLILANKRFGAIYNLSDDVVRPGVSFRDLLTIIIAQRIGVADEAVVEGYHARHRALITQTDGGVMISDYFEHRTMSISHRPMPDGGWVSTFDDITERRASEARIAHMARHDDLTGLPNRAHFNDHLDAEVASAAKAGEQLAVVTIDLDHFKEINDQRGHNVGDEVLKSLAGRLTSLCADGGRFVARLGGDEFAAIKRFDTIENVRACIQKLYDCVCETLQVDGVEIALEASLGVAMYPEDGLTREALLNNADLAIARAKASVTDKICYYEASMDEVARDRRTLAKDLERALKDDEFRLFYQVQQSVNSGEITGYEALIRWKHPTRGFVSPLDFIGIAEDSGAIIEIGAWVLRTACEEAVSWGNHHRIAVNLSPVQLNDQGLINTVREVLIETGLSPSRLELEITESTIIGDKVGALHILRQIKALGVTIAIDDFGTGYASLDTLNSFPFDKIKIDRSFLMEADKNTQARAIVRAILALGRSLDIPVLAEGVETEAQLTLLREEGCDEAQGYLLGRPMEHVRGLDTAQSPIRAAE